MGIERLLGLLLLVTGLPGCTRFDVLNAMIPAGGYEKTASIAYGDQPRQKLDVYRPRGARSAPVVVFLYGGSWQAGDRGNYRFVAEALTEQGCVAVLPDYRLYPPASFPAFVEDAAAAIAWAHRHAAEFGGDADRLFVMGHSAGAYNAVMVGVDPRYLAQWGLDRSAIRGIISLAGPFDILPLLNPKYRAVFGPPAMDGRVEPYPFIDGREPPILLLHGLDDQVVDPIESEQLAFVIRNHGGAVELHLAPKLGHAELILAMARPFRWLGSVAERVGRFVWREASDPLAMRPPPRASR